jgi:putative RecB family exonuclease
MPDSELPLVAPEYLSPSSISTYRQCPLKFKYQKIDGLHDPSGKEAVLGNFVHDVLEDLYKLPPEFRTQDRARILAKEQWEAKWSAEAEPLLTTDKERNLFRWTAWWCIENLWTLENPSELQPFGMESFVSGEIAGVKIHGYIDRISIDHSQPIISDYKTGKTPRQSDLDYRFFQLIVYSQLLSSLNLPEEIDMENSQVELLYLKDGVRFRRDTSPKDIAHAELIVRETRDAIDESCRTGEFEHRQSFLCNWCGFKAICPAFNK